MREVEEQHSIEACSFINNNSLSIPRSLNDFYGMNRSVFRVDVLHNYPKGILQHSITWAYKIAVQQSGVKNHLHGVKKTSAWCCVPYHKGDYDTDICYHTHCAAAQSARMRPRVVFPATRVDYDIDVAQQLP